MIGYVHLFGREKARRIYTATEYNAIKAELATLRGERATLADWIAEALSVLEAVDAEGDDAKRLLIEQGNALVVAVRGGER